MYIVYIEACGGVNRDSLGTGCPYAADWPIAVVGNQAEAEALVQELSLYSEVFGATRYDCPKPLAFGFMELPLQEDDSARAQFVAAFVKNHIPEVIEE